MPSRKPCKFCGKKTKPRTYYGQEVYVCSECFQELRKLTGDGS